MLRGKRWRLDGKTVKSLLRGEPPAPSREISGERADWIRGGARKVEGLSIADGCWVELWYFAQEYPDLKGRKRERMRERCWPASRPIAAP